MLAHEPREIHMIWMTTGLGCDGESVAITSATNPTLQEVLSGALRGAPRAHLHNPVLATEAGDDLVLARRVGREA